MLNIQPNTNNNISMQGKWSWKSFKNRAKQSILDAMPSCTFNDTKDKVDKLKNIDGKMSRPAENRGIMGVFALILQPLIDSGNKRVDDETRKISVCRTIAKVVAGTCVGMAVRGACYSTVQKMTDVEKNGKHSKALLPKKFMKKLAEDKGLMKNYRSALSTGVALLAMCITNFAIDAPLTVLLTNFLTEKAGLKKTEKQKEGLDVKAA